MKQYWFFKIQNPLWWFAYAIVWAMVAFHRWDNALDWKISGRLAAPIIKYEGWQSVRLKTWYKIKKYCATA